MADEKQYYKMSCKEVLDSLDTSEEKGLNDNQVQKRLEKHGKNELKAKLEVPLWLVFLSQFKELLVIILIVGGLISFLIGSIKTGIIIFIIVLVNAIIGFIQEYRAGKIVDKLKNLIKSPARVIRNGELIKISQNELVPGDIIRIEEGDKLPADVRLIKTSNFRTNEFALTGESMPCDKQTDAIDEEVSTADRNNIGYAGTTVASGNATGVVISTGMKTETGKIAGMAQEAEEIKSPLQKELRLLAKQLTMLVIIISVALFAIGMAQNFSIYMSLVYALGVAMAMVPQALPAQVTVALSTGSNRLAEKEAVVKNLPSVETLGSTTVICTDKTGTLTKNEMTVQSLWFDDKKYEITGIGYKPEGELLDEKEEKVNQETIDDIEIMLDTATMSSNAEIHEPDDKHDRWYPIGDPTEAALITASTKLGTRSPTEDKENPELQEFSFDSELKRMSSVRQYGENVRLTVKGSIDSILSVSKYIYKNGGKKSLTKEDKQKIKQKNKEYSQEAMRVLAIAYRPLEPKDEYKREEAEKDLIFLGLIAMIDPPKEGVKEAIEEAREAHIRTIILTGDHAHTAEAIAKDIGLSSSEKKSPVITGRELAEIDDTKLKEILSSNESIIFSRVEPKDKLRIVKTLESQDEIVAVTGDGVNDAPALRSAHIGVAMGKRGTDVSKEASRLVLLDDNFSTLVYAIEEGRTIFSNLKKMVLTSLTTNTGELGLVLLGLLAAALWSYPIPILAVQILAIDLLGQIMPITSLSFDPPSKNVMTRKPRDPDEHLLNKFSASEIIILGLLIAGLAFANFMFFTFREGITLTLESVDTMAYFKATALSYSTLLFCQFVNILQRRYERISLFNRNFFTNKILLISILVSIGLISMAIYAPFISDFLSFNGLAIADWRYVGLAAVIYLVVFEVLKLLRRKQTRPT